MKEIKNTKYGSAPSAEDGKVTIALLTGMGILALTLCVVADQTTDCKWQPDYSNKNAVCHVNSDCNQARVALCTSCCTYTWYDQLLDCDCGSSKCKDGSQYQTDVGATPYTGGTCTSDGPCADANPGTKTNTAYGYTKTQVSCSGT